MTKEEWITRYSAQLGEPTIALQEWSVLIKNLSNAKLRSEKHRKAYVQCVKDLSKTWPTKEWLSNRRTHVDPNKPFPMPDSIIRLVRCKAWLETPERITPPL
jgi:hypothetical protein